MATPDGVAVVTGGGVGIGRAICLALAAAGARAVVINYSSSADAARDTAAAVDALGSKGVIIQADVSVDAEARELAARTVAELGAIDVLVNNAGVSKAIPHSDLEGLSEQTWNRLMGVNLMGAFNCSRACAPQLRDAGGAIVNIASISGHRGVGASIPYAVSKAAVLQLTRSLAVALAPLVRVNSVTPGAVKTRLFTDLFDTEEAAEEAAARFGEATPLGRIGRPEDLGEAVVSVLGARFMTGQNVIVDGGRHLVY